MSVNVKFKIIENIKLQYKYG